jgi:micrococcal nuclease
MPIKRIPRETISFISDPFHEWVREGLSHKLRRNRSMDKMIVRIIVLITCLLVSSTSLAGQFKVITIYDGDTIMAEGHDIIIYVLLAGVDAPEIASKDHDRTQPFGKESKQYLERMILNKEVELKGYGIGQYPYNHLIGEIFLGEMNINIELIRNGLAEVWREEPPPRLFIAPYIEAQEEAKKAGRGIWSLGDSYMSPRDWRKKYTEK